MMEDIIIKPNGEGSKSNSRVMESLLKRNTNNNNNNNNNTNNTNCMNWNKFINIIWEQNCMHFPASASTSTYSSNNSNNADRDKKGNDNYDKEEVCYGRSANDEKGNTMPTINTKPTSTTAEDHTLDEIKRNGWKVLIGLMDGDDGDGDDDSNSNNNKNSNSNNNRPLIFQNLQPLPSKEIHELYGNNLYSAYLAGSSLVWNHVDLKSSLIAKLCQDLQGERDREDDYGGSSSTSNSNSSTGSSTSTDSNNSCGCFPHVYANAYLTPPKSQTVPPHADDRDVLIFQLCGRKLWNVYSKIPIKHPYPNEQVGKGNLDVPLDVLTGPLAYNDYLNEGDVLYIPRGMVHEAKTSTTDTNAANEFSFHITIAIATHDWTLGGNLLERMTNMTKGICSTSSANDDLQIIHKLQTIPIFRKSILPTVVLLPSSAADISDTTTTTIVANVGGSTVDVTELQCQINNVFADSDSIEELKKTKITAQIIVNDIKTKIDTHNIRSREQRNNLLLLRSKTNKTMEVETKQPTIKTSNKSNNSNDVMDKIIGPYAAKNNVSLDTLIRASTPSEREYTKQKLLSSSTNNGLHVRDEIGDEINTIIIQIKQQMTDDSGAAIKVEDFNKLLLHDNNDSNDLSASSSLVCNLTVLCLAKRAVELGAFAIATTVTITEADDNDNDKTSTNKMKRKDDDSCNEEVSSKQLKT
jgi:hypothetical protein